MNMKKNYRFVMLMIAVGVLALGVARGFGEDKKTDSNSGSVVEFKLPKPAYTGTPKNIPKDSTAEKPSGKPRAPWTAPPGVKNLALNKPVTSSDKDPIIGKL